MGYSMIDKSILSAIELRKKYGISYDQRIDLYDISKELNIKVVEMPINEKILGACKTKGIERIILLNETIDYPKRKRFTFAHELGHLILQHGDQYCDSKNFFKKRIEVEANHFASELLLPSKYVAEYTKSHELSCENIISISDLFEVSLESVSISLLKQYEYCIVLIHNQNKLYKDISSYGLWINVNSELPNFLSSSKQRQFVLNDIDYWLNLDTDLTCYVETIQISDGNFLSVLKLM